MACDHCISNRYDSESLYWSEYLWGGRTDEIDIEWFPDGRLFVFAEIGNENVSKIFNINYCPMCGRKLREVSEYESGRTSADQQSN